MNEEQHDANRMGNKDRYLYKNLCRNMRDDLHAIAKDNPRYIEENWEIFIRMTETLLETFAAERRGKV